MIVAGFHVPAIPLLEIPGNKGAILFWHSGPICANVDVTFEFTVRVSVLNVSHPPVVLATVSINDPAALNT